MIIEYQKDRAGIFLTTSNGKRFSIQFGYGMYCSNNTRDINEMVDVLLKPKDCSSHDCEVAVFSSTGEWITGQYFPDADQVAGYIPIEDVLRIVLAEESLATLIDKE